MKLSEEVNQLVSTRMLNVLMHLGIEEGVWDGVIEYVTEGHNVEYWDDTSLLAPVVTYDDDWQGTTRYLRTKAY